MLELLALPFALLASAIDYAVILVALVAVLALLDRLGVRIS